MLKTKYLFMSNINSNVINISSSSSVQDTLFELMKNNILIVEDTNKISNEEMPSNNADKCSSENANDDIL